MNLQEFLKALLQVEVYCPLGFLAIAVTFLFLVARKRRRCLRLKRGSYRDYELVQQARDRVLKSLQTEERTKPGGG